MPKLYNVEAEVHTQLKNKGYRVKVKILDDTIAMYINGMVVFTPSDEYPEWKVYTPKVFNARIVEFAKSSPLWQQIQEACIDAVKLDETYKPKDEVIDAESLEDMSDDEWQKQYKKQLDDLPF